MLPLTPAGESHRWISPDMKAMSIVSDQKASLVTTEEKTRTMTEIWKNNLLVQKKPNCNGIQCHDPRLNKHVVVKKAPEYNKYINIDGKPKLTLPCSEHPKFRNRQSLPILKTSDAAPGGVLEADPVDPSRWCPPIADRPSNVNPYGDELIPQNEDGQVVNRQVSSTVIGDEKCYNNDSALARQDEEGPSDRFSPTSMFIDEVQRLAANGSMASLNIEDSSLALLEAHKPRPLSPAALAQKLRRYKIGSSPKQKVRNMLDDMTQNRGKDASKRASQKDVGRGHSLVRVNPVGPLPAGETKDGGAAIGFLSGEGRPNLAFDGDSSLWDELDAEEETKIQQQKQSNEINSFSYGNDIGNGQLSNADYLYMQKAGVVTQQPTSDSRTGIMQSQSSAFSDDIASGSNSASRILASTSDRSGLVITGKSNTNTGSSKRRKSGTSQSSGILSATDIARMLERSEVVPNSYIEDSDGDSDSVSVPSIETFTSKEHARYLVEFEIQKKRGWRGKKVDGTTFDLTAVKSNAIDRHKYSQPWKVYKRTGEYNYQSGEEQSRGSFSEEAKSVTGNPKHPICHNCVRVGRLWCDHCARVYCYNCWGYVEHHEARHATEALAADLTLKDGTVKKTMPALLAPNPSISVESLPQHILGNFIENSLEASQIEQRQGSNIQISLPYAMSASCVESNTSLHDGSIQMGSHIEGEPSVTSLQGMDKSTILANSNQNRPMTDRIGSDLGSEPDHELLNPHGTASMEQPSVDNETKKIAQLSRINSEKHYFNQVTTPFVPPGSSKQNRLQDSYVEYDEINAIHFSPAKKNPGRAQAIRQRYNDIMAVTSERNKGYADDVNGSNRRQDSVAKAINAKVYMAVSNKYRTLSRGQGLRQIAKLEAARLDGRAEPKLTQGVGKLIHDKELSIANNLSIQGSTLKGGLSAEFGAEKKLTIIEVIDAKPVLLFENSPLNRKLNIPQHNADGSPHRIPPSPQEKFMLEKARKEREAYKAALQHQRETDYKIMENELEKEISSMESNNKTHNTRQQQESPDPWQEQKGNQDIEESALQSRDLGLAPPPLFTVVDHIVNNDFDNKSEGDNSNASSSTIKTEEREVMEKMREDWGFHPMRAKSSKTGNFPSLPHLGPPYTVDLETEKHYNTAIRPFSPSKNRSSTTPSRALITPHPLQGQTPLKNTGALWGSFKKTIDSEYDPENII